MNRWTLTHLATLGMIACRTVLASAETSNVTLPENLAPKATITSNFEHSEHYRAQLVADGKVPQTLTRNDIQQVWITETDHQGGAELVFQWEQPVDVKEILYYGPTVHNLRRCWKNYRIFLDDHAEPLFTGQFEARDGEQRIVLPHKVRCRRLRFDFLDHYGGRNPGAAEVMIFSEQLSEEHLQKLREGDYYEITRSAASHQLREEFFAGRLGFDRFVVVQRNTINPSHVYTYHQEGHQPGGGLYLVTLDKDGLHKELLVDASDGEILDCNVSYDGRCVLFSWKKTIQDKMQLFRINIDGTELQQITNHDSNNVNPCWLPDGGIAFLSDRKPAFAYCWITTSPILYRCDGNGQNVVRLSANYLNDFTPSVMQDGRILYSRWEYVDRPAIPIQSLWTISQDGTSLAGLFGNRVLSPATFMEARQIPGTSKVLCVMTAHNGPCRGAIGVIDPARGANSQEAIENVTPEVGIGKVDLGDGNTVRGPYESPFPIDDELFFVSKDGAILLRDYQRTRQITILQREGELGYYSAQPVRPTIRPTVPPASLAKDSGRWATLLIEDVYRGLQPHVERGEIKRIAVVEEVEKSRFASLDRLAFGFQFPVVSCGATYVPKKVWGFATVEADGSAHFKAPAGKPIYFMALDASGRALQRMRSFTHLMPGERQACIGCHADRNHSAPINRGRPAAALREVQELDKPDWGVCGFSYARIVQPVLDKHCVECHDARRSDGGIDLGGDKTDFFNVSYETLAREAYPGRNPYTKWIPTYNGMEASIIDVVPKTWGSPASRLAELILTGHPDENGQPRVDVDPDGRQRVLTWIDLNVPYYGTSVSNHYDLKGCRQMVPEDFEQTLKDVVERRCVECHAETAGRTDVWHYADGRIHQKVWTRITHPELNTFLLAPLAKSAGGTETCGRPVFASADDPDYQAILKTFEPVTALFQATPRMDMVEERVNAE